MSLDLRSRKYHLSIVALALVILIAGSAYRDQIKKKASQAASKVELVNAALMTEVQQLRMAFEKTQNEEIQNVLSRVSEESIPFLVSIMEFGDPGLSSLPEIYNEDTPAAQSSPDALWSDSMSGILIDATGFILTTSDVAGTGTEFRVRGHDGSQSMADLIASDPNERLALLRLREAAGTGFPKEMVAAEKPRIGDRLLCVGRSSSGQQTVSPAVLSLVPRRSGPGSLFILDGQMVSEQDGGLVLNLKGKIAGIVVPLPEAGAGGSIFVPMDRALAIAEVLKAKKDTRLSWIGISLQELNKELKDYFSVESGALVVDVSVGGPAHQAGIRAGDVITMIQDAPAPSARQLIHQIQAVAPETQLAVRIKRAGKEQKVEIRTVQYERRIQNYDPLGIRFAVPASPGIEISEVLRDSAAESMGLQAGDVVVEINGIRVKSQMDVEKARSKIQIDQPQLWRVERKNGTFYLIVKVESSSAA